VPSFSVFVVDAVLHDVFFVRHAKASPLSVTAGRHRCRGHLSAKKNSAECASAW
jgi:hypothetical protein